MQTCLTAVRHVCMVLVLHRAADTVNLRWNPDDERNSRSKHVELHINCRINTCRKCIVLVCLHNWLRCTVHTMSKSEKKICFRKTMVMLFVRSWLVLLGLFIGLRRLKTCSLMLWAVYFWGVKKWGNGMESFQKSWPSRNYLLTPRSTVLLEKRTGS